MEGGGRFGPLHLKTHGVVIFKLLWRVACRICGSLCRTAKKARSYGHKKGHSGLTEQRDGLSGSLATDGIRGHRDRPSGMGLLLNLEQVSDSPSCGTNGPRSNQIIDSGKHHGRPSGVTSTVGSSPKGLLEGEPRSPLAIVRASRLPSGAESCGVSRGCQTRFEWVASRGMSSDTASDQAAKAGFDPELCKVFLRELRSTLKYGRLDETSINRFAELWAFRFGDEAATKCRDCLNTLLLLRDNPNEDEVK